MTKEDILKYIKNNKYAVISTVNSEGHPEAALMAFGENDDLELIFGTYKSTRKYKNLKLNNRVALVIGWENLCSLQYEGEAFEIDKSDQGQFVTPYFQKNPYALDYKDNPDQSYWIVKPKWIKYTDIKENGNIFEFNFD